MYCRDPGFDCSPGKGTRQKLDTGYGIYVCVSVRKAGNRHEPPVLAAKANQPGERLGDSRFNTLWNIWLIGLNG